MTAAVQHSSTKHKQPLRVSAALGDEVVTRNLEGRIDSALRRSTSFEGFGCTRLLMPLKAYTQLREYAAQNPKAAWTLPCEKDGSIVWQEAELYGVELSGPFVAQRCLPVEDPSTIVERLAEWLVAVGLGEQPELPTDSLQGA